MSNVDCRCTLRTSSYLSPYCSHFIIKPCQQLVRDKASASKNWADPFSIALIGLMIMREITLFPTHILSVPSGAITHNIDIIFLHEFFSHGHMISAGLDGYYYMRAFANVTCVKRKEVRWCDAIVMGSFWVLFLLLSDFACIHPLYNGLEKESWVELNWWISIYLPNKKTRGDG